MDDVTLGKMLTEAHRGQADNCGPEGMSVSQSSSSVMFYRSGQPDERNSSNAQIRTLFEEQRQTIIAEYCEKVSHHELHAAHAEESADSYKDNYGDRNWNFVKLINKVLQKWKNYGNPRVLPSIRSRDEK